MKYQIYKKTVSGDLHTAVGLYLNLRDLYPGALLLESSDYHDSGNSSSFICLQPINSFTVNGLKIEINENSNRNQIIASDNSEVLPLFRKYLETLKQNDDNSADGVFGFFSYDAIRYFEAIDLDKRMTEEFSHPDIIFGLYRFVIQLNHHNDSMLLTEHCPDGEPSRLNLLQAQIDNQHYPQFSFSTEGSTLSNMEDEDFLEIVRKAKTHCRRGDVFQVVLSRRYSIGFKGDDLNVYRALRRINPSPYLYFFDFGDFRIFGSSPESQLKINHSVATLNPIAGTYRRTGNDAADKQLAEQLALDPKENAEHAMLVDLARNDLSRHCFQVEVNTYKEVQYFSHVIHLVSKVNGKMKKDAEQLHIIADTFPAGTLSGAPKYRAMQIIDGLEPQSRGFYGGAVGFVGLNGDVNLAILIRSFLSKNNRLYFQAGAGIVDASDIHSELQEVNNKLEALRKAITEAEQNLK